MREKRRGYNVAGLPIRLQCNQMAFRCALAALGMLIPTACAKQNVPSAAPKLIPVPIHGVNYTAEPFSFVLIDPQNTENRGGGEMINSFGAGGTMCCYSLPAQWRPGLNVEIAETYWLPMNADKEVPEVQKKHLVEVPPYHGGKAGELWIMRGTGGEVSIVASDLQPDHPAWPGVIKSWPVPNIEHRRKVHDVYIVEEQRAVDLYIGLLDDLNKDPTKRTQEQWEYSFAMEAAKLKRYRGPTDPKYREMLKQDYESSLAYAVERLERYKATRP